MRYLITAAIVLAVFTVATGDPLPGEQLKFAQQPMMSTPILNPDGSTTAYYGHDEISEADATMIVNGWTQYVGQQWMADDFADRLNRPVVHLRWWGSYVGADQPGEAGYAKKFLVEFLTDIPGDVGAGIPSRPGQMIQAEVVTLGALAPQSGTFTEQMIRPADPLLSEALYEYNCELRLPFPEIADTVYWLKIVHLDDQPVLGYTWGWHNRDYTVYDPLASAAPQVLPGEFQAGQVGMDMRAIWHFQDDAVQGSQISLWVSPDVSELSDLIEDLADSQPQNYLTPYDGPEIIGLYSKDLAFELYTTPEPATVSLLVFGGAALGLWSRRRR